MALFEERGRVLNVVNWYRAIEDFEMREMWEGLLIKHRGFIITFNIKEL